MRILLYIEEHEYYFITLKGIIYKRHTQGFITSYAEQVLKKKKREAKMD